MGWVDIKPDISIFYSFKHTIFDQIAKASLNDSLGKSIKEKFIGVQNAIGLS